VDMSGILNMKRCLRHALIANARAHTGTNRDRQRGRKLPNPVEVTPRNEHLRRRYGNDHNQNINRTHR